jgi:hypothetical protein
LDEDVGVEGSSAHGALVDVNEASFAHTHVPGGCRRGGDRSERQTERGGERGERERGGRDLQGRRKMSFFSVRQITQSFSSDFCSCFPSLVEPEEGPSVGTP